MMNLDQRFARQMIGMPQPQQRPQMQPQPGQGGVAGLARQIMGMPQPQQRMTMPMQGQPRPPHQSDMIGLLLSGLRGRQQQSMPQPMAQPMQPAMGATFNLRRR